MKPGVRKNNLGLRVGIFKYASIRVFSLIEEKYFKDKR